VTVVVLVLAGLSGGDRAAAEIIKIIRDTWDIPHVFADTDAGAFYGAGYATAADRMYQMHRARRAIQGRLAELVGPMGAGGQTTVQQDTNLRHRAFYSAALRRAAGLDAETRRLLQAYCDGVNRYIELHPDQLLYLFEGEVPEPWTPADCLAVWDRIADFFSGFPSEESRLLHQFEDLVRQFGEEEAIRQMTPSPIFDEEAAVVKRPDVPQETIDAMEEYARRFAECPEGRTPPPVPSTLTDVKPVPKFSHAWVVGGSRTTTGAAVLNSDPQTQISAPSIWYEIHMRGATFNARGVGIAGCPTYLIGWNTHIAWGLTALGADQADLFRLKMVAPNRYEYDGQEYDIELSQQQIMVKGAAPVPITVKTTHIGPVVTTLVQDVDPGEEYVLRAIPQWDLDRHSAQAGVGMIRAADAASFFEAAKQWRGPSANCVFGDRDGHIGYTVLAAIPTRSPCSPLAGMIAQDGSSSRYDWIETVPFDVLPHVFDPADGALVSGNHLPIGSWYPVPIRAGTGSTGDTERSWRLRERLVDVAPPVFTPEEVLDVHYESTNPARRAVVRAGIHLIDVQGVQLSRSAGAAMVKLRGWYGAGAQSIVTEEGQAIAYHLGLSFRENDAPNLVPIYGGGANGLCYFLKTLEARLDGDPQAVLDPDEIAYIDQSLARGYDVASANYGRDPDEWDQRFAAGPGTAIVGFFTTLEGFGGMDRTKDRSFPGLSNVDGGTIWSQKAQSFSQWVNLGEVDSSLALQPVGVSENPESPFFADQGPTWVSGPLRAAPLNEQRVEEIGRSTEFLEFGGGCVRSPEWVCDADVDGNGAVNPIDVGLVQAAFCSAGECPADALCQYDLDCNAAINPVDAGLVQSLFGECDAPRDVCP
jgi:penicillin amidase